MDPPSHNTSHDFTENSPSLSASTETRSCFASKSVFDSVSTQASPYQSYWNSPFTDPPPNPACPKFNPLSPCDPSHTWDTHVFQQGRTSSFTSPWSPDYYNDLDVDPSAVPTQGTRINCVSNSIRLDSRPPPYEPSENHQSSLAFATSNLRKSETHHSQSQGNTLNAFQGDSFAQLNGNPTSKRRAASSATSSDLSTQASKIPWSPLLGRALQGLYPESETFRESMQLLIQAYNKSTLGHGNGRSEEDDSGSDVDKDLHHDPSNTDTTLTKKTDQCAERKEPSKPLACPFFQRNPEKFQKRRSCAGPGYMNTHRLKEHLYRNHVLPPMCKRCSRVFKDSAELDEHWQSLVSCKRKVSDVEGCSPQQEKQLRSRKTKSGYNEVQKWREIYRILFPADTVIPSPFYQTNGKCCYRVLEDFKEHLIAELPKKIREDSETHSSTLINRLQSTPHNKLKAIVTSRTQKLFEAYLQKLLPHSHVSQNPTDGAPTPLKSSSRGKEVASIVQKSGLSTQAFPRSSRHPTPSSRRQVESNLPPETTPRHRAAKRIAFEESGDA